MILVSACLIGVNCKYNGKNNIDSSVIHDLKAKNIIPVCPEQLGGLTTPRPPSEIRGGDGLDVLEGWAKVITDCGIDVTDEFIKGAYETLNIAKTLGVKCAILKSKSPSCGSDTIYSGDFSGELIKGEGVTTALLRKNGIEVYSNEDFFKGK